MNERRREPRLRSLLSGKLLFEDRKSVSDCTVRNLSPLGALIAHPESFRMPKEFELRIPHRDEVYSANVVWRRYDAAGLALSPVAAPIGNGKAERQRMTPRQKERAILRARASDCF